MIAARLKWFCQPLLIIAVSPVLLLAKWEISAGPAYRWDMEIALAGPGHAQVEGIQAAAAYQMDPIGPGPLGATGDRVYDNGYVKRDYGTDNPNALGGSGLTWNWGMSSGTVYDAPGDALQFKKSGGEKLSLTGTTQRPIDWDDKIGATGWDLSVRRLPDADEWWVPSWTAGIRYFTSNAADLTSEVYGQSWLLQSYDIVDRFALSGVVPPNAPLYNGNVYGPGPVIPNVPGSRQAANFQTQAVWAANSLAKIELDADLWEMRLGPEWRAKVYEDIQGVLRPTISLNRLALEGTMQESFTYAPAGVLKTWTDEASEEEWAFGASIEAGFEVRTEAWSAAALAGYHWVGSDVTLPLGTTQARWEPSGFTVNVLIGYSF